MPYVIRPPRMRWLTALLGAALIALFVVPAAANAACATTATTKAFSKFGDTRDYSLVPNAAFESGTSGWSLTSASVASGNESYKVHGSGDAKSLTIQPTGLAVSPSFCVGVEHPTFRFFAKKTSGSWATMLVKLRWTDSSGHTNDTVVGSFDGGSYASWTPSPSTPLATTLPLSQSGQSLTARLVFDPEDYGGAWAIDDVYLDPYRR